MILWGMGMSQHVHGTDNARCLIALALMTGQIGRPGTGLHPLRGQNNVQGASDAGLIPMMLPDYQPVRRAAARARFEAAWGAPAAHARRDAGADRGRGDAAIQAGEVRGMYVMGENPAMCDPDANHAREALAALDIWWCRTSSSPRPRPWPTSCCRPVPSPKRPAASPTPTAWCRWAARRWRRRATRARTCGSSSRSNSSGWTAGLRPGGTTATAVRGVRRDAPHHAQHRRHHLGAAGARTRRDLPLPDEGDPGEPVVFVDRFPRRAARRASCRPTSCRPTSGPTPTTRWC